MIVASDGMKRCCEIGLRHRPFRRRSFAGELLRGIAKCGHGLFKPSCVAVKLAEQAQHAAKIILRYRPVTWRTLSRDLFGGLAEEFQREFECGLVTRLLPDRL